MCDESRSHGVGSSENWSKTRLGENSHLGVTAFFGTITQGQAGTETVAESLNQGITYRAKTAGNDGNSINIRIQESTATPSVTTVTENVASKVVSIYYAIDDVGRSSTTVNDVVNAVNNGNLTLLSATGSGVSFIGPASLMTVGGTSTGVTESVDLTVLTGAAVSGSISVMVSGIPHSVTLSAGQTPDEVAVAIAGKLSSDGVIGYTVSNPSGAIVRFTSTTSNTNVPDLMITLN